jgi:hypothetical protein
MGTASLAELRRAITAIVRGDRFSEGNVADELVASPASGAT